MTTAACRCSCHCPRGCALPASAGAGQADGEAAPPAFRSREALADVARHRACSSVDADAASPTGTFRGFARRWVSSGEIVATATRRCHPARALAIVSPRLAAAASAVDCAGASSDVASRCLHPSCFHATNGSAFSILIRDDRPDGDAGIVHEVICGRGVSVEVPACEPGVPPRRRRVGQPLGSDASLRVGSHARYPTALFLASSLSQVGGRRGRSLIAEPFKDVPLRIGGRTVLAK